MTTHQPQRAIAAATKEPNGAADEGQAFVAAFREGSPESRVGGRPQYSDRNSLGGGRELTQRFAKELVELQLDLILSGH
jgi:hypothetical protein